MFLKELAKAKKVLLTEQFRLIHGIKGNFFCLE